jgi:23S rRNA pseudouridine2605 synthase
MTTDGALKRRLELPSTGVPRSYRARAYGPVTQAQLEELIHGIEIDGVRYGQIDANLERRTGTNVWIEMTLKEGKNREVRRVLEHLGLRVSRLIRTRYGPFALEDLPPGAVEEVKQHELVEFLKELGSAEPQPAPEPGIKGTALRKHWRITPSKVGFKSPSPVAGVSGRASPGRGENSRGPFSPDNGQTRGARRGEGRAASAGQNIPIPKYRPDPVERSNKPAPARPPAPARSPAAVAEDAPRPPRPRIDKSGWAKAKPKPGRGPKK